MPAAPSSPTADPACGDLAARLLALCRRPTDGADRARAARLLSDWMGCALAATVSPLGRGIAGWAADQGTTGRCTALGFGRSGAETAAFANGALGNLYEMDDLHRASILHAGDVVHPAALATAQAVDAAPERLLESIVVGYEVALRIGMAAASAGYSAWYNSATCGVFGAAAASARVRDLSDDATADALGLAGMQAAGLWQCRLGPNDGKQIACAHAARAGVAAADLAARGMRGPAGILDGPLGFFSTLYPQAAPEDALADPDAPWRLHEVSLKPWPACRHTHPAIGLALGLRGEIDPSALTDIVVSTYAAGQAFCDDPSPRSDHAGRFSFQHCVAVALLRGAPRLSDFDAASRRDPSLAALRGRVRVVEDPALTRAFPQRMGAALALHAADGTVLHRAARHAPGDPEDALDDATLRDKFLGNAGLAMPPDAALALHDALEGLPQADDLARLATCLETETCPA